MEMMLPDLWFVLIGFVLFLALTLDGYDLGIGILSLFTKDENRRDIFMGSIGGFWHANLTWLVVTGGLFFGAFPLAYAIIFSALYIPAIAMILALAFRGVALDIREESEHKAGWGLAFGLSSLAATLTQGFVIGGYLAGLAMEGNRFVGGVWGWLNPFAALVALAVLSGYVLLGATWLIIKAEGDVQLDGYRYAWVGAWTLFVSALPLVVWSFYRYPFLADKWFTWPGFWLTLFPLLLAAVAFIFLNISLSRLKETAPFLWSMAIVALGMLALAASIHPYIIPPSITLDKAASPNNILGIMFIVMVFMLPIMLVYNGYSLFVFRGKVTGGYGKD